MRPVPLIAAFTLSALSALSTAALAEPARTECLAGAKPGGGFDLTCRLAGNALHAAKLIKDPMAVTYMEGGVGAVAYNHVIGTRPADAGLIVAASSGSALLISQGKFGKHDENAVRWVGSLGTDFGVVAVAVDSPIKSLKDLIEAYGKEPTAFPIGGGGAVGSQDWMKMALIAREAKADPKKMRYAALEGGGAVTTALQGGHIKIASGDASEMIGLHEQGKLRILAVMAEKRPGGRLKDIPTTFELGYQIDWPIWRGVYVGPGVSDADYTWWADTLAKLSATPEFEKEREARGLFKFDLFGADFDKRVKADVARFRSLAKDAGL
jgi:putative tricarboxylic transport membrane protein